MAIIFFLVIIPLIGFCEVGSYETPQKLAQQYYPIIHQSLKMPLGVEKEWRMGIQEGNLYKHLLPTIIEEIASKRSEAEGIYVDKEHVTEESIEKTEVLEVLKNAKERFINDNQQTILEKRMTETLELFNNGMMQLERDLEEIRQNRSKKPLKLSDRDLSQLQKLDGEIAAKKVKKRLELGERKFPESQKISEKIAPKQMTTVTKPVDERISQSHEFSKENLREQMTEVTKPVDERISQSHKFSKENLREQMTEVTKPVDERISQSHKFSKENPLKRFIKKMKKMIYKLTRKQ